MSRFACLAFVLGRAQNFRVPLRRTGTVPNISCSLLNLLMIIPACISSPDDQPVVSYGYPAGSSDTGHLPLAKYDLPVEGVAARTPAAAALQQPTDLMLSVDCHSPDCLQHCCGMREHLRSKRDRRCKSADSAADNQLLPVRWLQHRVNFVVLDESLCGQHSSRNVAAVDQANNKVDDDICYDFLVRGRRFQPRICEPPAFSFISMKFYQFYHREKCNVSTTFLVLTLALYVATPKLRRKVHDKCFLCYLAFFILGCLAACSLYLITDDFMVVPGYLMYFGMLSSYFWLNVMCIDMLRSINAVKSVHHASGRPFMIYTSYALGCPFVLSVITFTADYFLPPDCSWKPGIAKTGRFIDFVQNFSWLNPSFIFFHIFVYITFVINGYAFVRTALRITKESNRWGKNKNEGSHRHKKQQARFLLYLKLFILMGLNNIGNPMTYYWHAARPIRFLFDAVHAFQGVFIFVLFVFNRRVLSLLKERFFPFLRLPDATAVAQQQQKGRNELPLPVVARVKK